MSDGADFGCIILRKPSMKMIVSTIRAKVSSRKERGRWSLKCQALYFYNFVSIVCFVKDDDGVHFFHCISNAVPRICCY